MTMPTVRFNRLNQPEFFKEVRKRVNKHFKDNNISKHANFNMKLKTVFMLNLYLVPLVLMVTGVVSSLWTILLMWALMGLGMSGTGLSVMHDANHGSYSKHRLINRVLGYLANFLGAYHVNWKIQHNVLHHSYTNVEGLDDDIKNAVMRFSPNQKRRRIYRFQAFYAPFLYGLMTLNWLVNKDFSQLIKYRESALLKDQGITFRKAMAHVIFNKALYLALILALPLIFVALPWWQILLGFLLMQFICGLLLALIFQTAHVVEETDFYEADASGSLENSWAIHQMHTTANFGSRSVFFSWFIGGLNYQIEHHLFPNICHVHYKRISKIVKETAKDFNLPYNQHRTFFHALKSHFLFLDQLGTGEYDRKLAVVRTK